MSCCHVAIRVASILQGNTSVVADLFGWGEDTDYPTLTGNDESVKTPGLFLLGSQVRHQAKKDLWIFCFIYKCEPVLAAPPCFVARACGREEVLLQYSHLVTHSGQQNNLNRGTQSREVPLPPSTTAWYCINAVNSAAAVLLDWSQVSGAIPGCGSYDC